MRIIYSYALFGEKLRYWECVFPVILWHHQVCGDCELRIHFDALACKHPLWPAIQRLADQAFLTLTQCEAAPLTKSMLWRMKPVWDSNPADIVACRDIDSLPSARDRKCVAEFETSHCIVHVIRDNPAHSSVGLLGGLCAYKPTEFVPAIRCSTWNAFIELSRTRPWHLHGQDQQHLEQHVYSRFRGRILEHVFCGQAPDERNVAADVTMTAKRKLENVSDEVDAHSSVVVPCIGGVAREFTGLLYAAHWCFHHGNTEISHRILDAIKSCDTAVAFLKNECGYWEF